MFRRTVDGEVLDFGTTGLLRASNLVMYDRQTESWWQEFSGEAIVGDLTGTRLELLPLNIVPWKEFKATFPNGKVLSRNTGHRLPYGYNPYASYDSSARPFMYRGEVDRRLRPLDRVVGITIGKESLAVPYLVLEEQPIVHYTLAGQDLVIFFKKGTASALDAPTVAEGRDVGSATVFDTNVDRWQLTFSMKDGRIVDDQTGTVWRLLGKSESGLLKGRELRPLVHRPGLFWFSWVVFKPDTVIYKGK